MMLLTKTKFIVTPKTAFEKSTVKRFGNVWVQPIIYVPIWARYHPNWKHKVQLTPLTNVGHIAEWPRSQIKLHS